MADQYTPEEIRAIFEEYNNATKNGSQATAELTNRFKSAADASKAYTAQLNASLKSLGSSVLGVAKAMKDGEQGASVYNNSINAAADAVDAFAAKFGFLGKIIGTMITAGARYAAEVNKQSDALFNSYKELSSSGLSDAGGMRNIFDNMQKFGYGIEQLGTMTALLKANSKELAAFGGTAAKGTAAFADAAGQIQRSDIGKSLQMLGKTPDDINKGIAGFVRQQQLAGVSSANIQKDLAQRSAEYVKQLDLMSKLTGESNEALQANRESALAESAFNQTIYELQKKGDKESIERAAELQKASDLLAKTPALQKEFWQGVGGDISAMGKSLMISADAVQYTQDANFKAATFVDKFAKGAESARESLGPLFKLNALEDVLGSAKELSIVQSRYAGETAQQQEDRARAEQKAQLTNLDRDTKAQVEMRIEQMKTRDSLQSMINKGIGPATDAMKHLASATETAAKLLPGTGTSTGTQMGGKDGPSGGFWSNLFGKSTGDKSALLELIGKGESKGNYNALVYGKDGAKTPESADLINMTIDQVQQLQKTMIAQGHASTAVGKYQMISATLAEQAAKAGLDTSKVKFNQQTQDLLAKQLIDQAGYGKKDIATVMKNLAGTWASLPKDMSGAGAYDKFNGNKASVDPKELVAAIKGNTKDTISLNSIKRTPESSTPDSTGAPAISGPTNRYDSKLNDVKPDKTLPAKEDPATSKPAGSEPEQTESYNRMIELLERQTRLASETNDNLGRIRQNTAV